MPRVPQAQNFIERGGMTDARFKTFESGAEQVARGVQGLAGGVQDFAIAQQRIQDIQDEAAAKALDNETVERTRALLWTGPDAFFNKQGFDAANARPVVEKALNDLRGELTKKAATPQQRRMFEDVFNRRIGAEMEGVARHSIGELVKAEETESVARGINARNEAVTYADLDPVRSETALSTGLSELRSRADKRGWAPEVLKAEEARYVSDVRVGQIDAKTRSDPVTAMALLERYRDEILPEDEQKLRDTLYEPMMERQAVADIDAYQGVATDVVPQAPQPGQGEAPTMAKMVSITAFTESRNRDFNKDGSYVTSPKGARGRMQVMPGTQRDPGFGVKPAANDSPEELARVGREYLAAMMKRYGGDPAKAWAAYNAGPGAVDNAVKAGGGNWLARMPAETKNYVHQNVAALGGGQPGVGRYAPRQDDLAGIYRWIDQQPWDFERKQNARGEADRRVARNDMLLKRQEAAALDRAYEAIEPLGERFTSLNQLPPDVRRQLPPEARMRLREQAEANARPKPVEANGDAALGLELASINEPSRFAQTDLRQYRHMMTAGEFASLAVKQAQMRNQGDKAPIAIDHGRVWETINRYGVDVGIDAKKVGKEGSQARAEAMRTFSLMNTRLAAVTGGKRAPTDDEIKAAFDASVMTVKLGGEAVPRFRVPEGESYRVAVPNAVRDRIVQSLRRNGRPVTEQAVTQTFLQFKGQAGFW